MSLHIQKSLKSICGVLDRCKSFAYFHVSSQSSSHALSSAISSSPLEPAIFVGARDLQQRIPSEFQTKPSDINSIIARVQVGSTEDEVLQCLLHDPVCNSIPFSHELVYKLLQQFKDDWKSALGVFRWAKSLSGFKHTPDLCDIIIDTLGKSKQMVKMKRMLEELKEARLVTLDTVAKAMRRFAGAGEWEDAVRIFDDLGTFGLEKNTESMNVLLDTLCKEEKVERARQIYLELKSHIPPNANTFNMFIHGWCKVDRVEEAHWTLEEMKGHGFRPCVISYSTIIRFYCRHYNFSKVYELLDEMDAQGCPANVITYTTIMDSLTKSEEFEEALQIAERMKSAGCELDTLFYNCLIHTLGRAGKVREVIHVFEVEMPSKSVLPNTSTYNSIISIYCHHAQEQKAMKLLEEMEKSGLCKPDVRTYHPLLKSCFRTGKIDYVLSKLLEEMIYKHHLSLDISTYSLLIHGLCRANRCEWAYQLFEKMIDQDIKPRYLTCQLLLDEVKQKNMNEVADRIKDIMKNL
ncbi:pentatricopeptide repeat-containing protein At3g04130, mitochondrial [Benincasa hispida]|uniref:pentatricopeptide repeat-containing protein At3g04130, mitochondrial n=1 Tax=Benincasa hispida TaxID=102211 RepID=UPI001901C823|nr:pentatricopeptide repeat-containing protein At3g04130, mitochondrial [Benincasa hispida]